MVAVLLGMAFEKMNVAFMVALAFGVASCANFPVLLMSMYWKGLTTRGALVGGYTGLISSVLFVVFVQIGLGGCAGQPAPLFPYTQPALFAMPLAFLAIYVFSKLDTSAQAQAERAAFDDQYVSRPNRRRGGQRCGALIRQMAAVLAKELRERSSFLFLG